MSNEEVNEDSGTPTKKPIVKILLIALLALIVLAGAVGGTLFAVGFFDPEVDAESAITAMEDAENSDSTAAEGADDEEQHDNKTAIEGEQTYFEIKPEFLSNLYNSQRMIQVQIAVMLTENEDATLVEQIQEHAFPVRSSLLKVLSEQREDRVPTDGFRDNLAVELRDTINDVLESRIGSRDIQEVYFTEFIVQ